MRESLGSRSGSHPCSPPQPEAGISLVTILESTPAQTLVALARYSTSAPSLTLTEVPQPREIVSSILVSVGSSAALPGVALTEIGRSPPCGAVSALGSVPSL